MSDITAADLRELEETDAAMESLCQEFPKVRFGTTAPRAKWNKTGKRLWEARKRNRVVAEADSPKALAAKLRCL